MPELKAKKPLLAAMLSVVLVGLGQVYAGRKKRGIIFFFIPVTYLIIMFLQLLTPFFGISMHVVAYHFKVFIALGIFFSVDAYFCARSYNSRHNLTRKKYIGKDILFIIGILLLVFIFNPFHLFAYTGRFYIAECIKISQNTMAPTIQKGDEVIVNKFIYKLTEPRRYEVALFRNKASFLIARIAGLPKDTVEIKGHSLLVNGVMLREFDSPIFNGRISNLDKKTEVPPDTYFVIPDNNAPGIPVRFGGFISKRFLKGRAYKIYYPFFRAGLVK